MKRSCLLYKFWPTKKSSHIRNLLPQMRNSNWILPKLICIYVINEWKKPNQHILSYSSYNTFRNALLNFIRPDERKIFNISDPLRIKMLLRLCWKLDVRRTAVYEITLAVRLSVRLWLTFLKIGSLFFSDILYDDSWTK